MQRHILCPTTGQIASKHGNHQQAPISGLMKHAAIFPIFISLRLLALTALFITIFATSAHADHDGPTHDHDTNAAHSEQSQITPASVSSSTQATTSDTSITNPKNSKDTIEQFVAGDFSQRQAMLSDWPGTIESLDSLVEFIANDELYQGNGGQTYLLNADDQLFTYPDQTETTDWPSDLSQVTLTNALRSALVFGQAKVKLKSDKPAQRLQAVDILANNINQVDPAIITAAADKEDNAKVQKALTALQARIDFKNGDLPTQITAVGLLADSDSPQVLVDIESALAADNLDSALKAALIDAESSVSRRIEIST